jgi:hypothetical protein
MEDHDTRDTKTRLIGNFKVFCDPHEIRRKQPST